MNNRSQVGFTRSCNNFELPDASGLGAPCRAHGLPPPPRGDLERGHPLVPGGKSNLWTISRQSLPGASPRPELSVVQVNVLVHVLGVVLLHLTYPEQFMLKIWPGDPFTSGWPRSCPRRPSQTGTWWSCTPSSASP